MLVRHLDAQRRHVRGILGGLTEEQLHRAVLPSGWHCLGLVRHLALADERYWFRCVVAGEPLDCLPEGPDGDWHVGPEVTAADVFERYEDDIRRSDAIIAATALDAPPRRSDPVWARWGLELPDLRSVLMHVITETAVHAGHLDAVRELIDGRQWAVVPADNQEDDL